MGGFTGLIAEGAEKLAPHLEEAAAKYAPKLNIGKGDVSGKLADLSSKYLSIDAATAGSKAGTELNDSLKKYEFMVSREKGKIAANPTQYFKKPLDQITPGEMHAKAHEVARPKLYGDHDENLATMVDNFRKEKNAISPGSGDIAASNLVDSLGIYFHESRFKLDGGAESSRLFGNLSRDIATKDLPLRASPYQPSTGLERGTSKYLNVALAYKAGLMHLTTPFNVLMDDSLSSAVKSMNHIFGVGFKQAAAQLKTTNAIGEILFEEAAQHYNYEHGVIKNLKLGTVGRTLQDNIHIPGLSGVRKFSMVLFGHQGRFRAQELADVLRTSADPEEIRRAMFDCKLLGLDGDKIRAQGLSSEDLDRAAFENANRKMFLEGKRTRSPFAMASPRGRVFTLYHGYASGQRNFILNTIRHDIQRRSIASLVKDMAILGAVFPAVGAGLNAIGRIWRGKDPQEEMQQLGSTEAGIFTPEGYTSTEAWANKMDAFAHMAGLGIMISSYKATSRHKLLSALMGPAINAPIELIQDSQHAIEDHHKDIDKGPYDVKSYDPLMRDLLHDVPSLGLAPWISEHYFPTKTELQKQKPVTLRQMKAKEAAERRKALRGQ